MKTRSNPRTRTLPLLLALTLAACGGPTETGPAPPTDAGPPAAAPPAPELWTTRALIADGPPTTTGGTFQNSTFINFQTYESCINPDPPHCVSYTAYLPTPPSGWELQVTPVLPVLSWTGQPASYAPPGRPHCVEPLLADVVFGTDAWTWHRPLPAGPIAIEPGATRLTVSLCVRGEIRVQLGELSGALTFVPRPR